MTVERKILVGIGDIKAVTFECLKCHARTTVPSNSLREIPSACSSCNTVWYVDIKKHVTTSGPAEQAFIDAIRTLQDLIREKKEPFRILLEFDAPKASQ